MKYSEKKELLSKLKLVNNLDKQQRFSQKVLRKLRSNDASHNSSFQKDDMLICKDNKLSTTGFVTPDQQNIGLFNNIKEVSGEDGDFPKRNEEKVKSKQQTQMSQQLQEKCRFQSQAGKKIQSERRTGVTENNSPSKMGLKTLSSLLDMNCITSQNKKRHCAQCSKRASEKDRKIAELAKQVRELNYKLQISEQRFNHLKESVTPYINNVNLMSAILENLADKKQIFPQPTMEKVATQQQNLENSQLRQAAKVNMWLLKEGKQKAQHYHNQSYRLKCQMDSYIQQIAELRREMIAKDLNIKASEEQLRALQANQSIRQRMQICHQELHSYKIRYHQKLQQSRCLSAKLEQFKYKINVLTSLIGCAIIFDTNQKQKDKKCLKQVLNKIEKYEYLISSKISCNGLQYLKMIESFQKRKNNLQKQPSESVENKPNTQMSRCHKLGNKHEPKQKTLRKIYIPNYLILLGQESVAAKVEHIVIKPVFFIKMRAVLDSKYIDYRLHKTAASPFPQFCNFHLKHYEIQQAEKKQYLISRKFSQIQFKDLNLNFISQLMDYRIQDLPEVQVFREFLFGKYEEDQIYFYLMCRHKLVEGNELQNFINSGDPSKFIKYDKAKRTIIKITQNFGRTAQNFICHHINQKKIIKENREFSKLYYVLKLLLMVYQKVRVKKIQEFKVHFYNILTTTKDTKLNYLQFHELLRKNFQFLSRTDIIKMFRQTIATFQSQKGQAQFFQCFVATCATAIFIKELIAFDDKLQYDCEDDQLLIDFKSQTIQCAKSMNKYKLGRNSKLQSSLGGSQKSAIDISKIMYTASELNQLNELWPDSVYILGNQQLNRDYSFLSKAKFQKLRTKVQILSFLLKVGMGHLVKQSIRMKDRNQLNVVLDDGICNMIEFLNKIGKNKIAKQNQMNLASKKIGTFFKNKTYEFYNEMLQDTNSIKVNKKQGDIKRSKKYSQVKTRISKFMIK